MIIDERWAVLGVKQRRIKNIMTRYTNQYLSRNVAIDRVKSVVSVPIIFSITGSLCISNIRVMTITIAEKNLTYIPILFIIPNIVGIPLC